MHANEAAVCSARLVWSAQDSDAANPAWLISRSIVYMSGAVVRAWPAFLTGGLHPGCQCTRDPLFRPRDRFSAKQCQTSAPKRQRYHASSAVSNPQAVTSPGTVRDQPSERQQAMPSSHTVVQGSFNTADDPQGTIAGHSRRPVPGDPSSGQQVVGNSSTYSKEDRAKLASIPESEMTPEMLRRWRISKANKGKQPWNKGRQHPPGIALTLLVSPGRITLSDQTCW